MGGDDVLDLGFVDRVGDTVVAQIGVQGDDGQVVLKAAVGGDDPFGSEIKSLIEMNIKNSE